MIELSASAVVEAFRNGDVKAEDYATALLSRAHRLGYLNAFRTLNPELVLEAARAADQRRASGAALGMLHGLPVPVKDSVNTKDLPTSYGAWVLREFQPKDDAVILKRLLAEGAILMGKTNLHELSFGWTSNHRAFGPVRNPYNLDRIPGGSSGGSGAAVAARIAPLAIAADTLGSIRVPATMCGLAGFRPTLGRYPNEGIMALTLNKFDQVGPLARSVADLLLFDTAITGDRQQADITSLTEVRIGVSPDWFWSDLDPEVERICSQALERLSDAGATIVKHDIPEAVKSVDEIARVILRYETEPSISKFLQAEKTGVTFEQLLEQLGEEIRAGIKAAFLPPKRPSREKYESILVQREAARESISRYFHDQDIAALVFPPVPMPPPRIGEDDEVEIHGQKVPLGSAIARNIKLGSCAGMASMVLPAGMTTEGLPVGLEFDALPGNDRQLLSLGALFERALGPIPRPAI